MSVGPFILVYKEPSKRTAPAEPAKAAKNASYLAVLAIYSMNKRPRRALASRSGDGDKNVPAPQGHVLGFIDDEALSRGAAIAFYSVTSLAPVLLVVIAIAGLAFGREAAQGAILNQLSGLMGQQAADVLQTALASASTKSSGIIATVIGLVTLLATASGVFGEMQAALNRIWRAEPKSGTLSCLVRARAASSGLVAALGFLLAVSLVVSAGITALGARLNAHLPYGEAILSVVNFTVSLVLLAALFAAIYKVLPDRPIAWRDVVVGALVTALLFTLGKTAIGWYLGSSAVASSYGAAGGLIVLFLWV